jgi:hypothetical protein
MDQSKVVGTLQALITSLESSVATWRWLQAIPYQLISEGCHLPARCEAEEDLTSKWLYELSWYLEKYQSLRSWKQKWLWVSTHQSILRAMK